jgi:hypothetical protein
MRKSRPNRPEHRKSRNSSTYIDPELITRVAFDAMSKPGIAEELREIANKEGITLDIVRDTLVAMTLRHLGQPVPPELRGHLSANYPSMGQVLRKLIIKPDLN